MLWAKFLETEMQAENFEWNLDVLLEEFIKWLNPYNFTIKNKLWLYAQHHFVKTVNIKVMYKVKTKKADLVSSKNEKLSTKWNN